jgi:hypothetical protein
MMVTLSLPLGLDRGELVGRDASRQDLLTPRSTQPSAVSARSPGAQHDPRTSMRAARKRPHMTAMGGEKQRGTA